MSDDLDGDNERYTLDSTYAWCCLRVGVDDSRDIGFQLDAAATSETARASAFFTKRADGLSGPWFGNVWVNPPWDDCEAWVLKAHREFLNTSVRLIAMLLPANRCDQAWWQNHVEPHRDRSERFRVHFLPGRTRFGSPGDLEGKNAGSPKHGTVLLVWRRT